MNTEQRTMLFAMLQRIVRAEGVKDATAFRREFTEEVFGEPRSWAEFGNPEVDRMKVALQQRLDELNLGAIIKGAQYRAHDGAQAGHVPVVTPGKQWQRRPAARKFASRYERMADVDDPGERARSVYFISRLFSPAYIRRVVGDLFSTADWEDLPIPRLTHLKDALKNRLGKWLTKHKETYAFGFSIANTNSRSRFALLPNEKIIGELLQRGVCVDMGEEARAEVDPDDVPF
mgnify:CR=1 FL=1